VRPAKGQDVLLESLAGLSDLAWRCACVGSLDRDPRFVTGLARRARATGLVDRWRLVGSRTGADLDAAYAASDVVVLASRAETYGMVVTEALSRGLPVIASAVGGVPEALGLAPDGSRPGLLVPSGEPAALREAIREWLTDARLRQGLRASAAARRAGLRGWEATAALVSTALDEVLVPSRVGGGLG
jgi:glycosyltransferase involved in cell wall biosynthesis